MAEGSRDSDSSLPAAAQNDAPASDVVVLSLSGTRPVLPLNPSRYPGELVFQYFFRSSVLLFRAFSGHGSRLSYGGMT